MATGLRGPGPAAAAPTLFCSCSARPLSALRIRARWVGVFLRRCISVRVPRAPSYTNLSALLLYVGSHSSPRALLPPVLIHISVVYCYLQVRSTSPNMFSDPPIGGLLDCGTRNGQVECFLAVGYNDGYNDRHLCSYYTTYIVTCTVATHTHLWVLRFHLRYFPNNFEPAINCRNISSALCGTVDRHKSPRTVREILELRLRALPRNVPHQVERTPQRTGGHRGRPAPAPTRALAPRVPRRGMRRRPRKRRRRGRRAVPRALPLPLRRYRVIVVGAAVRTCQDRRAQGQYSSSCGPSAAIRCGRAS